MNLYIHIGHKEFNYFKNNLGIFNQFSKKLVNKGMEFVHSLDGNPDYVHGLSRLRSERITLHYRPYLSFGLRVNVNAFVSAGA